MEFLCENAQYNTRYYPKVYEFQLIKKVSLDSDLSSTKEFIKTRLHHHLKASPAGQFLLIFIM